MEDDDVILIHGTHLVVAVVTVMAAKLWSSLPVSVIIATTLEDFKSKLKFYLFAISLK